MPATSSEVLGYLFVKLRLLLISYAAGTILALRSRPATFLWPGVRVFQAHCRVRKLGVAREVFRDD